MFKLVWILMIKSTIHFEGQIWFSKASTNDTNFTITYAQYLADGNCQSLTNKCKIIPTYPRPRSYHTSISYVTFNKTQSDEMCPGSYCGPLCQKVDPTCSKLNFTYPNYPIPNNDEGLIKFNGPETSDCPDQCCDSSNEYCYRTMDNTGNPIEQDQDQMLVFGGLAMNEVTIDSQNIADNCTLPSSFALPNDTTKALNTIYLINNCGNEILNELWNYNIKTNKWTYIKPHIDPSQVIQQKPNPRYGHSAVYVEKTETSNNITTLRKYMYIYGGFSLYCQNACDDMWNYEIAFAPQRYYPDPAYTTSNSFSASQSKSKNWNRGNRWSQVYPSSLSTPGKKLFHTMVSDEKYNYIYLFGGISIDSEGIYTLNNDLWRYDLNRHIWEKLNPVGIIKVFRKIVYWDGTSETIIISPQEYNRDTDALQMDLQQVSSDNTKAETTSNFPRPRCANSMTYTVRNSKYYILIFGGYYWNTTQNYNLQIQLNDMWVYSLSGNSWMQVFPNSDDNPDVRYGSTMVMIDDSKLLLYGGLNSETVFSDLWLFNINSNMWMKIQRTNLVENANDWPLPVKFASLVKFSRGLVLYGGSLWLNANITQYSNNILKDGRLSGIVSNLWVLYSDECSNQCSSQGTCNYGRCICNQGHWGKSCQNALCKNSYCYTDLDLFASQVCYHCSGHGSCNGTACLCEEGWLGDDCSIHDCPNKCSGKDYGTCIVMKPISQCNCFQDKKRGGDDCSTIFCLNSCGTYGTCDHSRGYCTCEQNYIGLDCSIYMIDFRTAGGYLVLNKLLDIVLVLALLI